MYRFFYAKDITALQQRPQLVQYALFVCCPEGGDERALGRVAGQAVYYAVFGEQGERLFDQTEIRRFSFPVAQLQ